MDKIKVGIIGYGNLGKGVETNIRNFPDMELEAIFTRRDPSDFNNEKIVSIDRVLEYKDKIDIMILCGGSSNDLPKQGPELAKYFNTIDSYDNHQGIPKYFDSINKVAKENNKTSIISIGWDPGLFSLNRLLFQSILPQGEEYTFWGKGVSQGHSQVVRSIEGVKYGVQYTVPVEESVERVKAGENPSLSTRDKHKRICYVVAEDSSLEDRIREEIVNYPNYFKEYDTEVYFIDEDTFFKEHSNMPHGGSVIRSGKTNEKNIQTMEFNLNLGNNPEFTSSVLLTYARAGYRLNKENKYGAYTIFDLPISYLSDKDDEWLRKNLL